MGKLVAVEGCTLSCKFGGTAHITTQPSNVSFGHKKAYAGTVMVSVENSQATTTVPPSVTPASGTGSFILTCQTAKTTGQLFLREGDTASVTVNGEGYMGQSVVPTTGIEIVTVESSGQNVVKAT